MKNSTTRLLLGLVSTLVCTMPVIACVPPNPVRGAPVTAQDVASQGTRSFKASRAKVFAAAEGALKVLGYSVAFSDAEAGLLKTQPKQMTATASSTGYGGNSWAVSNSTLTVYTHSYALKIT